MGDAKQGAVTEAPPQESDDQAQGQPLSADIFISYSRKDIAFARLIRSSLQSSGLDTWIDWDRIPVGGSSTNWSFGLPMVMSRLLLLTSKGGLRRNTGRSPGELLVAGRCRFGSGGQGFGEGFLVGRGWVASHHRTWAGWVGCDQPDSGHRAEEVIPRAPQLKDWLESADADVTPEVPAIPDQWTFQFGNITFECR